MTRNEKIALAIGGGVVVFGGLAIYFSATSKPPSSASPTATPPQAPPQQFAPTTSPTSQPAAPELSPNGLPPSWNAFTSVVAGHKYLVTLTSSTPLEWWRIINPNAVWGGFRNPLVYSNPTAAQYQYTLEATETHRVQNIEFLLGVKAPVAVTVVDLG